MSSIAQRLSAPIGAMRRTLGSRDLRRLLLAFVGFNLAEWGTWIAALVFAYNAGGAAAAGLIAFIQLVPAAIAAPFVALLGDRFPRERVLVVGYLTQSGAMFATGLSMVAKAPTPLVYVLAALAATSITVIRPTQGALLPALVGSPDELTSSNAAASVVEGVCVFAGPAIAGVLLGTSGPGAVYLVMAGGLLISALCAHRIRPRSTVSHVDEQVHDLAKQAVEGFRALAADRGASLLVSLGGIQTIVWGALDVLIVVVAIEILGLGTSGVGYLNSALGLGGVVGAVATIALVGRRRLTPMVALGIGLWGIPIVVMAFASQVVVVTILLAIAGGGRAFMDVAGRTLLQRVVPDDVLTRVLGVLEGAIMGGLAIGSILAPLLISILGPRGATIASGVLLPVCGALAWPRLTRIDHAARVPSQEIEILRRSPIFAPLSAPAIERIAADLIPLTFPVGAMVIRQGDVGDRYYLVLEGELDVIVDGDPAGVLGWGDGFGEIALLRDVPRTATVATRTEVRLFALQRDRFLEAVTGHAASLEVAHQGIIQVLDEGGTTDE